MSEKEKDFYKFPRTHHLVTVSKNIDRDDLVMDLKDGKPFFTETVIVEEKIDGANLGISIDPETLKNLCQNRSHYVTSQSATQWKGLDQWIQDHPKLYEVLDPHYILFGEWLYAKHSVPYDKLPGYFVAFDIFDKKQKKFLSISERNKRLKDTEIPIIKNLCKGVFKSKEDYIKILQKPSNYRSKGTLEGIYLRIDKNGYLDQRAKIVREDFIQQIEQHWSSKELEKNVVDYEAMYDPSHYGEEEKKE